MMADHCAPDTASWLDRLMLGIRTQSWLASMAIHMAILIVLALVLGTIQVAQVIVGPQFEASAIESATVDIEPVLLTQTPPYEPTTLDTEALTAPDPAADPLPSLTIAANIGETNPLGNTEATALVGGPGFAMLAEGIGPLAGPAGSIGQEGIGNGPPGVAQSFAPRVGPRVDGPTKASERSVAAALNWLARHQNADGSWSLDHTSRCKSGFCSGPARTQSDPAATALALLPFLAAGQTHQSNGPYRKQIAAGINYLVKTQAASGDLSAGSHQMYAHGLATIALCEAYGMTQDSRLRQPAEAALRFIESGQNAQGGWRYAHAAADSDTSVLGWQVMALKSGQMAGLTIRPAAFDGSKKYLQSCASGTYGSQFSYTPGGRSTEAMTSVGLLASQYLGARRGDPAIVGGLEYLTKHSPAMNNRNTYYWYYATQVMHNVPGPEWDAWNRQVRRLLIDSQERTGCQAGSWDPAKPTDDAWGSAGGRLMVTSLSTLTLEVYYRYLPLYGIEKIEH